MLLQHVVQQGECLSSIAFRFGFFPDTLWKHGENSDLRRKRKNPNALAPGDVLVIPEKELKEVAKQPEHRYRFRKKGVPAQLNLKVLNEGEPVANQPFVLVVDGVSRSGTTDGQGGISVDIVPDARHAALTVGQGGAAIHYELELGHLDPIDTISGVQQRLRNLGFDCPEDGQLGVETIAALRAYQADCQIKVTGQIDSATRVQLERDHDFR